MATNTKTGAAGEAAAWPEVKPPELHTFGVRAKLSVDPNTPMDECVFDALCLMNAGMAALDALVEKHEGRPDEDPLLWSVSYLLHQAHAVLTVASGAPSSGGAA